MSLFYFIYFYWSAVDTQWLASLDLMLFSLQMELPPVTMQHSYDTMHGSPYAFIPVTTHP